MLDLIEILFSRHGIQSLRFDGKMSREMRDTTLATFKKPGGPKVILIRCVAGYLVSVMEYDSPPKYEMRKRWVCCLSSCGHAILTRNTV